MTTNAETMVELAHRIEGHVEELANTRMRLALSTWNTISNDLLAAARVLRASVPPAAVREGIYIASKVKHAERWRLLRDRGEPIISTWINETGEGQTKDHNDLWRRCIAESSSCKVLITYREPGETLKGAWVEIGTALQAGVPVFAIGIEEYTIAKYRGIKHFPSLEAAFEAARALSASAVVGMDVQSKAICDSYAEENQRLSDQVGALRYALQFIADGYDNHDVNHVDFRVKAYQVATETLEAHTRPERSPPGEGK